MRLGGRCSDVCGLMPFYRRRLDQLGLFFETLAGLQKIIRPNLCGDSCKRSYATKIINMEPTPMGITTTLAGWIELVIG